MTVTCVLEKMKMEMVYERIMAIPGQAVLVSLSVVTVTDQGGWSPAEFV